MAARIDLIEFHREAERVMLGLRSSLLALLASLASPVKRAADLERALGLSSKLAWQVHKVAHGGGPLEAAAVVPGAGAMKGLLRAALASGVDKGAVQAVAKAMEEFERFVDVQAGDRASFDAMLTGLAERRGVGEIDTNQRRTAFRANSHIWGAQARTHLACMIVHPGSTSDTTHLAMIRGMTNLRRLRPDVPVVLSRFRAMGVGDRLIVPESLDAATADGSTSGGPALLADFCTRPLPDLLTREGENHVSVTELAPGPIGNAGAVTAFLAGVVRDIPWKNPPPKPPGRGHVLRITLPTETVILDTLFHRDMFGELEPETKLLGSLDRPESQNPKTFRESERLPVSVETEMLGFGPSAVQSLDVPRYPEMLKYTCDKLGWAAESFQAFRCRFEYPILHSLHVMYFRLPEHVNW